MSASVTTWSLSVADVAEDEYWRKGGEALERSPLKPPAKVISKERFEGSRGTENLPGLFETCENSAQYRLLSEKGQACAILFVESVYKVCERDRRARIANIQTTSCVPGYEGLVRKWQPFEWSSAYQQLW